MVDIKREDITLQDWTKGISADEFAWGSYYYAEAISSGYNTKGFELWYGLGRILLNKRKNWYSVALCPCNWNYGTAIFTRDGRIEMEDYWNWNNRWAYYAYNSGWLLWEWYLNGVTYWDYLFAIRQTSIDKIHCKDAFDINSQLLTNTTLTTTTWWTFGTWWSATSWGAKHTTGNTGTLKSDAISGTYTSSDRFRLAVKITGWTAWSINLSGDGVNETINDKADGWYVKNFKWSSSVYVSLSPTSDFDGTIEAVQLYQYDMSEITSIGIYGWIYSDTHPALVWEWDLYVASRNYINIINLNDNWVTYKEIIDRNFTIVAMNQQAWNIILWATDGFDSRQYYWNWVDAVATEVIEWKGLIIKCACGTETISYVLTTSWATSGVITWYEYRLYAVSWYQRNLIASKLYQFRSGDYLESSHYNANKKFDFNDVTNEHGMTIFLDSLYIPWCDGVYKYWYDIPWLRSNWTKPIKYDTGATHIAMGQRGHYLEVAYTSNGVNYIGQVDNRLYQPTWFLVTEAIYWDKLSSRKALEKIKIWYKNVPSTVGNIKVYAIVDDTYFWRFRPTSTPTTRPTVWAVYNVANNTKAEVIDVDTANWVITLRTTEDKGSYPNLANTTLTKVSWTWDASITVGYNYDNMCLIKTIESGQQEYNSDLIFWKDFVNTYLPFWHKIQFVVELNSNDSFLSPEVYEISMNSDITDITL